MGYRQRKDSWEVNVAHKGMRRFATVATEAEAKDKEIELKAELIQAHRASVAKAPTHTSPHVIPSSSTSWTLEDAIAKTVEVRWAGTKSESFYEKKCDALVAHFGGATRLADIKTAQVDAFKLSMTKRNLAQSTINHHLVALSMVFKIAHQREGVAFRPVLGITKKGTRSRIRWLTEMEEKILLSLLTQWDKPDLHDWTCVMLDTGMRPSETKHMTGSWVDFRDTSIHVQISKTPAGIRTIPMTTRVKAILERRCLAHPKGYLFPYGWQTYTNAWDRARSAMKLTDDQDFVAYALRHTFGTRLGQRGERIDVIMRLMGHENSDQTMKYVKLGAEQYVSAIARLEKEIPVGG